MAHFAGIYSKGGQMDLIANHDFSHIPHHVPQKQLVNMIDPM